MEPPWAEDLCACLILREKLVPYRLKYESGAGEASYLM